MIEWALAGGIQRPKHRGQPGQPRPEPVARTSPPAVTARKVSTVVRRDSRASRDIPGRRIGGVPVPDKAGVGRTASAARVREPGGDGMHRAHHAAGTDGGPRAHRRRRGRAGPTVVVIVWNDPINLMSYVTW